MPGPGEAPEVDNERKPKLCVPLLPHQALSCTGERNRPSVASRRQKGQEATTASGVTQRTPNPN